MQSLTKSKIINSLMVRFNLSKSYSEDFFNEILKSIFIGLTKSGKVKISLFGTFFVYKTKKRSMINPKTKLLSEVRDVKKVKFHPSKSAVTLANNV